MGFWKFILASLTTCAAILVIISFAHFVRTRYEEYRVIHELLYQVTSTRGNNGSELSRAIDAVQVARVDDKAIHALLPFLKQTGVGNFRARWYFMATKCRTPEVIDALLRMADDEQFEHFARLDTALLVIYLKPNEEAQKQALEIIDRENDALLKMADDISLDCHSRIQAAQSVIGFNSVDKTRCGANDAIHHGFEAILNMSVDAKLDQQSRMKAAQCVLESCKDESMVRRAQEAIDAVEDVNGK